MIADKDYSAITIKCKDTTCARIYLDKDLLMILLAHILSDVREAAAPEDLTDTDDILDRINYIYDLAESLLVIHGAIHEIKSSEILENIPPEADSE